jgi:hypothetical protein
MSELASLLRMHAAECGNARRASRVRHLYLSDKPLMLLPLKRTGPAARPLAFILGTRSSRPRLLIAPPSGPIDSVLADLAEAVNSYITSHHGAKEHPSRSGSARYTSAPQLLVPNPRAVKFLQQFGLNLSFRQTGCQDPTRSIRRLGQWLTYFATRAEVPGSAALIPLTKLLAMHWITGQSPQDDEDLATLLAWIYPQPGSTGRDTASQAEALNTYRSAGPATDAAFDNEELLPLFQDYSRDPDGPALQNLQQVLAAYLRPTWDRMWQAYQLLKAIPQTPSAVHRWGTERREFTHRSDFLGRDGRSKPARDSAAAACTGFELREREATAFNVDRAREDPFVRAELRSTGEAVGGTVTAVDTQRTRPGANGQDLWRPTVTLVTKDLVSLEPGRFLANHLYRPARYRVTEAVPRGEHTLVHLEITAGMGYVDRPNLAVLPAIGDFLELTPAPEYFRLPVLPPPDQTPWTHRADSTRPQHLPMRGGATPSPAGPMPPAEPDIPIVLTELGALTHRGMVVHAPPGAGKSTLVVHATDHLVRQGAPCAVIAQTNTQVDQLVRRIAKTFPRLSIGRLTATTYTLPNDLRKLPRVRASTSIKRLNDADITIGTAEKWASLTDATDKRWPWAIIDEAYQMRSSTLLHTANRFEQILFVGDPGQLAPFSQIDTARWAGLPHHPIASAATVVRDTNPGLPVRHLPVSWRLPPSAVPLISSAFYPSEPFRAGTREADRALTFTARGIRAPSLDATIEHAAETGWALLELPARYTPRLDHEALHTILALAERLLIRQATLTCENEPQRKPVRPVDITIGTAHSIQAERLRTLRAQNYPHMRGITIDTANRLQGHEASISLILHPLSGRMDASAFHLEAGRLCVLMSRHRQSCIVVARARIANILDTHPGDEPVHLGTPSKPSDGWESHHTVMEHLSHHTIRAQTPP